jgi:eukaryotic-like serine/threonine-protein kinase
MSVRFESLAEPARAEAVEEPVSGDGFGEVWKCEAPGGIFKAVKVIHGDLRSKDSDLVRYAEQELKALKRVKQVRHPYLLALDRYDIVDGRLMIVMELADCNLWDRFRECRDRGLPGIPRDELMQYMLETAEVLDLMNDQFQLQHLDIKPQNLFLLYNHVKVADFGQVKDLQGLMATVTGGITPVYAAPETFDGIITRYCDQYSLACVYQELLVGVRPFDGSSMSQLLMQHVNLPPNLEPSPRADRPALARALAKRPEERWPTVTAFVRALAGGSAATPRSATYRTDTDTPPRAATFDAAAALPGLIGDEETPRFAEPYGPVFTPAPPERTGSGPLQPALVIGLGGAGLKVLQRLRFDLAERYGPRALSPAVRALYIDTDPDALDSAARGSVRDRLAPLDADEIFAARLNRSAHYLKPRFNGRSLIEGWFDPQLLYKLPRTPTTMGVRLFGRLAFLDHYRALMAKVQAEIEAALSGDALERTATRAGVGARTNRPRVYIAGGLAGGTGGGMFLDLAYATRSRLKRMGYDDPDVIGLFVVPPADATLTPAHPLGNTHAALLELNHYARADVTFAAHYDERGGAIRDKDAPFARVFLVPGTTTGAVPAHGAAGVSPSPRRTPVTILAPQARPRGGPPGSGVSAKPGSRAIPLTNQRSGDPAAAAAALKPFGDIAERVRLDLFAPVGRAADEARFARDADTGAPPAAPTATAFGLAAFEWPRTEVVARTAWAVGRDVLKRWALPDQKRFREVMPALASARWRQLGFDPDAVLGHLTRAADLAAGGKIDELLGLMTEPLVPRGWLARMPEPTQVALLVDKLNKLFGPPSSSAKRAPTAVEEALARAAQDTGAKFVHDLHGLLPALVDDEQFRLAGTEELYRQFLSNLDRLIEKFTKQAAELDSQAGAGFEVLSHCAHFQKGMRRVSAADLTEALRQYPRARFQAVAYRFGVNVYQTVRDALASQLADVSAARQKVVALTAALPDDAPAADPAAHRKLMPPGCASVADAVALYLRAVTDADLAEIDRRVQQVLEASGGGLYQMCLNSSSGVESVANAVFEEARAHLDARLGEVDLAGMFAERFRTPQQAERAIEQAYQAAEPAWTGTGPWVATEVAVLACPGGTGEALRELARRAIPVAGLPVVESRDDLTVYREWPDVPLAALPHFGPAAAAAYNSIPETAQCSAHARLDVTAWHNPDAS